MSDGEAMLRSILAGKGSAHALADWIVENLSQAPEREHGDVTPHYFVRISDRRLQAYIRGAFRNYFGVWVRLSLEWGPKSSGGTFRNSRLSGLIWVDPSSSECVAKLCDQIQETFQFRTVKK